MKQHTEQELIDNNQLQISRLARLYKSDRTLFDEICSILPVGVSVNHRNNLDSSNVNDVMENWMEKSGEEIVSRGFSLIREISDPEVLSHVTRTIHIYDKANDPHRVCSYLQFMKMCGEFRWILTHKVILSESSFLNTGYQIKDLGLPGRFLTKILDETLIEKNGWKKLQSLTRREREILRLVAKGHTTRDVSELLFISELTVKTHRKRITQKLQLKNLAEMIRFAHTMEIVCE